MSARPVEWYDGEVPTDPAALVTCADCAAVVLAGNAQAHVDWHEELDQRIRWLVLRHTRRPADYPGGGL